MINQEAEEVLIVGRVISLLRPGASFSLNNGDRSTLVFHDEGVSPISDEEYAQGLIQYQELKTNLDQQQAEARAAAEAKLAPLGLTVEDIKALLS